MQLCICRRLQWRWIITALTLSAIVILGLRMSPLIWDFRVNVFQSNVDKLKANDLSRTRQFSKQQTLPKEKTSLQLKEGVKAVPQKLTPPSKVEVFHLKNLDFSGFGRRWSNSPPNLHPRNDKNPPLPECVKFKVPSNVQPKKLCIHSLKADNLISAVVRKSGSWEYNIISRMARFFRKYPNSQLVDLGCNIGVFSIYAASMGVPVLAVDIVPANLALIQLSIATNDANLEKYDLQHNTLLDYIRKEQAINQQNRNKGIANDTSFASSPVGHRKLSDLITTIRNAVSNKRTKMQVHLSHDLNMGHTEVEKLQTGSSATAVEAVCLDDLIPYVKTKKNVFFKMDVEGFELNVIRCASRFFKEVDVEIIFMEIMWLKGKPGGKELATFFTRLNFVPYPDSGFAYILSLANIPRWPDNIYWVKKGSTFPKMDLNEISNGSDISMSTVVSL